jgi:phosphoglucosamine mutase
MNDEQLSLQQLGHGMQVFPQTMINVPVPQILRQHDMQAAAVLVREAEQQLNGNGRVLLRPSGTEPLVRVMVEGEDRQLTEDVARHLAEKVAAVL